MPLLHSGTQRNHKDFSSDVPSNAVLVWHQMQNFFGKLWLWLCLGRPREEDKRATTNVQNGLVFFFLFKKNT